MVAKRASSKAASKASAKTSSASAAEAARGYDEGGEKRKPVVFMLQPTEFLPVKPRKMKEWEEQLKSVLGNSAPKIHQMMQAGGFRETTSICPGGGADDCDVFEGDILVF
jgi:hypothetical protein